MEIFYVPEGRMLRYFLYSYLASSSSYMHNARVHYRMTFPTIFVRDSLSVFTTFMECRIESTYTLLMNST